MQPVLDVTLDLRQHACGARSTQGTVITRLLVDSTTLAGVANGAPDKSRAAGSHIARLLGHIAPADA